MKPKNSPTIKVGDLVELTIDSLSYSGGRGVGRADGLVIFVPGGAPGDRVRARVQALKPRFAEAELVEVLKPSPARREPPCPVFGRCGGCAWQHVAYTEQVRQKQEILRSSLRGLRKLGEFTLKEFWPAPAEFGYRNRIQLQFRHGRFGFFAKRSNDLVEVEECLISEPALNRRLRALEVGEAAGQARLELALTEDGEVRAIAGRASPEEALFAQVNRAQNEILQRLVVEAIHAEPAWLLDLYAGAGNLTFPLAQRFSRAPITAIELSRASVERGRRRGGQIEWRAGDVAEVLREWHPPAIGGAAVLDPPRSGCDSAVIESLARLAPKQIVYVSCNPSTFARDAERLIARGYRLESVQGLDMFPQTEHVELVASLCAAL